MGPVDAVIVVCYVSATTLLGIWLGRGQRSNRDFFLGGRHLPASALLISIVATETSTVTFLSVPGKAFVDGGDFTFLQIAFGYIVGRLAVVAWLMPGFFRGEMLTAYEVLEHRFGISTRRLASLVFLVTRNLADGLRLFLTALALNIAVETVGAVGLDFVTCVILITLATAVYSCLGGVRSVVWNDCVQFATYMIGAIIAAIIIIVRLPGGWTQLMEFADSTGRLALFDFDFSFTKSSMSFWSGLIGGAFLSLASHGADHLIVQRYLCAKDRRSASWALALSGPVVLLQFALFLFIGLELACYYSTIDPSRVIASGDQAFITFVVHDIGVGLSGLILAAVLAAAMSTLSSSLNASASSLLNDWFGRTMEQSTERRSLTIARLLTLVFAAVQATVAIATYELAIQSAVVDAVLTIAGFTTGLLLGLYGLGLIAPRTSEMAAIIAFAIGTVVTSSVAFATHINGLWYTLIGSGTIVIVGLLIGPLMRRPPPRSNP